jgi:hypothetical protein
LACFEMAQSIVASRCTMNFSASCTPKGGDHFTSTL